MTHACYKSQLRKLPLFIHRLKGDGPLYFRVRSTQIHKAERLHLGQLTEYNS